QYELMPMLGTASLQLAGMGRIGYNWLPRVGAVERISVFVYGRRFSYALTPDVLTYSKIQPEVRIYFRQPDPRSTISQVLSTRSVTAFEDYIEYDNDLNKNVQNTGVYNVNEVSYSLTDRRAINPYDFILTAQQGPDYGK